MFLAYNTNGLAHHRLDEALRLLAQLGYGGVALTPDVAHLDLARTGTVDWLPIRELLQQLQLQVVVETGARYVLDPNVKHWPNLLTRAAASAERRILYYQQCCALAQCLGASVVSIWSGGVADGDADEAAYERLVQRLPKVLDQAGSMNVTIAFEPEPGMLIDDLASYRRLRRDLGRDDLATTLDTGHLLATELGRPEEYFAEFQQSLRNVQVDDARRGVHEHLPLGEGEIEFEPIIRELRRLEYDGPFALELSRDSHRGAAAAAAAMETLRPIWGES